MGLQALGDELAGAVGGLATVGLGGDAKNRSSAPECARRFDEVYTVWVDGLDALPAQELLEALQALDGAIHAISSAEHEEMWRDEVVASHPTWDEIRALADRVLSL